MVKNMPVSSHYPAYSTHSDEICKDEFFIFSEHFVFSIALLRPVVPFVGKKMEFFGQSLPALTSWGSGIESFTRIAG